MNIYMQRVKRWGDDYNFAMFFYLFIFHSKNPAQVASHGRCKSLGFSQDFRIPWVVGFEVIIVFFIPITLVNRTDFLFYFFNSQRIF